MARSLGHHPDRMTNRPGDPMDWDTHQAVHQAESDALSDLGINGKAFDLPLGNTANPANVPPRRPYGNDH